MSLWLGPEAKCLLTVISHSIVSPLVLVRELTCASSGLQHLIIVSKFNGRMEGLVIRRAEKYVALQRQPDSK
jgi:hypothetical protein